MEISFQALEYTAEDIFVSADFIIKGNNRGWVILRNNNTLLQLGPGYELLQTLSCGICSTDIDRRFLPFALPQVTGHEIVARRLDSSELFAVEINDSSQARGEELQDVFCREQLPTHSPDSMVLGIDRLPGGFGPYILAPKKSIIPLQGLDELTGVLVEPFAAALQAITASPPQDGDEVVVLGPGRLGMLIVAALTTHRATTGKKFRIGAIARQDRNIELSQILGADFGINILQTNLSNHKKKYDIVYDTTGSVSGFDTALELSRREIHLKSTNGREMCGVKNLTPLVVDELSLLPFNKTNINFTWPEEQRINREIFVSPANFRLEINSKKLQSYSSSFQEAEQTLASESFAHRLPRFDIAVAGSIAEIDAIIRPSSTHQNSLLRPRGAILFKGAANSNKLLEFITAGGRLRSSRCGDLSLAVKTLTQNPKIAFILQHSLISHVFPACELPTAFNYARKKESLKVVIRHQYPRIPLGQCE